MKRILAATAAAMLMAAPAYAGGDKSHDKQQHEQTQSEQSTQSESSMGGSGQAGMESGSGQTGQSQTGSTSADQAQGEQQLSGTIIKIAGNNLFIEHMGAAVPLELNKKTQYEGEAQSKKDLKEGEQITASFTVKNKVRNIASSVSLGASGMGGSGSESMDQSGTGGSGSSEQEQRETLEEPTQIPREDTPQPIY